LLLNGYEVEFGRNLNKLDVESGRNVAVIGSDVAEKFFSGRKDRALEKVIRVGSNKYRVIGVMKEKGSSAFLQMDNVIITGYNNVRRLYTNQNQSFSLAVQVDDLKNMEMNRSPGRNSNLFYLKNCTMLSI